MPRGRRANQGNRQEGDQSGQTNEQDVPPPPPPTMEQLLMMQTQILQQLAANMAQQQQYQQNHQHPAQNSLGEFMRTKPSEFEGSADPLDADDWLKEVERKLNLVNVGPADRVKFAAHQLKGVAADWWDNFCAARGNNQEITWPEFAEAFRTAHIPPGIMEMKKKEFRELRQGKMTVPEYLSCFTQLARYAKSDLAREEDKTSRFLDGLNAGLKDRLVAHDFPTFQHLVNKAILQENTKKVLEDNRKRKTPHQNQYSAGSSRLKQRHKFQKQPQQFARPAFQTPRPDAGGAKTNPSGRACFNCGQEGHFANACPKKNAGPTPVKFNLGSAMKTPQASQGKGLFQTPGGAPRTPGPAGRGRVNHVTAEQAREAPDVVLGMFLINSHFGSVLFDSGASHSFVAKSFAMKHGFDTRAMKRTLKVKSPGGTLMAGMRCPRTIIVIEGVEFLADLILLDSQGLDVILGMDWLSNHQGVIDCASGSISLTNADGVKVEFKPQYPSNMEENPVLNSLKALLQKRPLEAGEKLHRRRFVQWTASDNFLIIGGLSDGPPLMSELLQAVGLKNRL